MVETLLLLCCKRYLLANRGCGVAGCKHFSKANAWLKKKGREEINWASVCSGPGNMANLG